MTRARIAVALATIVAAGAVGAVGSTGLQLHEPNPELCLGQQLVVGVRRGAGDGGRRVRITVADRDGTVIWQRSVEPDGRWQRFVVRPPAPGRYRTTYRRGEWQRTFGSTVIGCIQTDDGGRPLFGLQELVPGRPMQACVAVRYAHPDPGHVALYGATGGTGLGDRVRLVVARGTLPWGDAPSCDRFVPDTTDHRGLGAGVVFAGPLSSYPQRRTTALLDPDPADPHLWRRGERHAFRFTVQLEGDEPTDAEATQRFSWEASPAG